MLLRWWNYLNGASNVVGSTTDTTNSFMPSRSLFVVFFYLNEEGLIARCGRFCPLECETVLYTATLSTAYFPSNSYGKIFFQRATFLLSLYNENVLAQKLLKNSNFTRLFRATPDISSVRQSVLRLEVFYTELTYTTVVDEPYLLWEDLIVQFGGVLSLFLGSSFLSFMEIFDMIAEIAIIACSRPIAITKVKSLVKGN